LSFVVVGGQWRLFLIVTQRISFGNLRSDTSKICVRRWQQLLKCGQKQFLNL
jgi:hypothetical protein